MLPFAIVDFRDGGGGVSIIPSKWFTGPAEESCFWPPGRVDINKAIKDELAPEPNWPQYRVRILGKAGNFENARTKLRRSEVTSDLQTESDSGNTLGKGKRKRRPAIYSSSEEDLDNVTETRPPSAREFSHSRERNLNITRPFVQPALSPLAPPPTTPTSTPLSTTSITTSIPRRLISSNANFQENMMVRVLTLLEEIKETQRVHGRMLHSLMQQRDGPVSAVLPEGAIFPLQTIADIEGIELKLGDPVFLKEVVAVVAEIGGTTVDDATRRMMTFIMTNPLSREFNFVGRHGKREFRSLKLFEVLYGSLKKNALTSQITRKEAEKAASKWFIGARDRGGNRNARTRHHVQERPDGTGAE